MRLKCLIRCKSKNKTSQTVPFLVLTPLIQLLPTSKRILKASKRAWLKDLKRKVRVKKVVLKVRKAVKMQQVKKEDQQVDQLMVKKKKKAKNLVHQRVPKEKEEKKNI